MSHTTDRLPDSSVLHTTGVDVNKIFLQPSELHSALPLVTVDGDRSVNLTARQQRGYDRWMQYSHTPWFLAGVAEDWCRHSIWKFTSCLRSASNFRSHTFGPTLTAIRQVVPPFLPLLRTVQAHVATPGLAGELQSLYRIPEIPGLENSAFWDMVARLLLSGDLPTDYSRREGPTFGQGHEWVSYSLHRPLGIWAGSHVWGRCGGAPPLPMGHSMYPFLTRTQLHIGGGHGY